MLDLSFGLPIVVRDAALKMVAPGPQSAVNREYYAQNHEKDIEEGVGTEGYEKTDEKGRELLRRLAKSQPYFKKQRRIGPGEGDANSNSNSSSSDSPAKGPGPIRTRESRGQGVVGRGGRGGRAFPSAAQLPPSAQDILPPQDPTITSLFITGVEDDLPEHKIRDHFTQFGKLRSLVCSHMSHCAFINYAERESAEAAAKAFQGKTIIAGCLLRVQWGKPRPIGTMDKDERMAMARKGRTAHLNAGTSQTVEGGAQQAYIEAPPADDLANMSAVAAPPGADDVNYASLAGN